MPMSLKRKLCTGPNWMWYLQFPHVIDPPIFPIFLEVGRLRAITRTYGQKCCTTTPIIGTRNMAGLPAGTDNVLGIWSFLGEIPCLWRKCTGTGAVAIPRSNPCLKQGDCNKYLHMKQDYPKKVYLNGEIVDRSEERRVGKEG